MFCILFNDVFICCVLLFDFYPGFKQLYQFFIYVLCYILLFGLNKCIYLYELLLIHQLFKYDKDHYV